MSVRQLWEGCDAAVWAQRLDGRTKLLGLFLVAVLAIVVDNPRTLFLLFTATLLLHLFARTSVYKWQVLAIYGDLCLVRHYFLLRLQERRYLF